MGGGRFFFSLGALRQEAHRRTGCGKRKGAGGGLRRELILHLNRVYNRREIEEVWVIDYSEKSDIVFRKSDETKYGLLLSPTFSIRIASSTASSTLILSPVLKDSP